MTMWEMADSDGKTKRICAEYWLVDPDVRWVFFKNSNHKIVFGVPERRALAIWLASA